MCNRPHMSQRDPCFGCTPHGPSLFALNWEDQAKRPRKPALVVQKCVQQPQGSWIMLQNDAKLPLMECGLGDHPWTNINTTCCLCHWVRPCKRDLVAQRTTSYLFIFPIISYRLEVLNGTVASQVRSKGMNVCTRCRASFPWGLPSDFFKSSSKLGVLMAVSKVFIQLGLA